MLPSNCEASNYEGIIVVKLFALAFCLGKNWLDDPYQSQNSVKTRMVDHGGQPRKCVIISL
jgi:hypothetical protein